ncbi:MAG TPA: formyltransferase family protein [Polyangiaceae bacterium]
MRIAYFGMPLGALLLERDQRKLVYVAISRDDAPGVRRVRRVFGERAFVRPALDSPAALDRLEALAPDLIVSWFWTKRLPREILALAPAIGVHPSLLPRHRGADPFFWAIDSGDEVTGVTAHRLDETYDTGAILRQVPLRIDASWNAWTLAKKLDRPSLAVLREVVAEYARGAPPEPRPQNDAEATEAPSPTEDMLEIRWTEPAERIARRVRAAAPWPGAFTEIGGETVVLLEVKPTREFPRALEPGEAAVRKDGVAVVRAADFALELRAGRREEDDFFLDQHALASLLGGRGALA